MSENDDNFLLRPAHLRLFRKLDGAFRDLLVCRVLTPDDILGIVRGIRIISRLPVRTPGLEVAISIEHRTSESIWCSTVRLSPDTLNAYSSEASLRTEGEWEASPTVLLSINIDGGYEVEGSTNELFQDFVQSAKRVTEDNYTVTVVDDSQKNS